MSKTVELIAQALADAADDGCFDNPPTYDDEGFLNIDVDIDEWHSGEEDRVHWLKLARASVSKLTDAGYSIVQLPKPEAAHTLKSGLSYQSFPVWASKSPVIVFSDGSVEFYDVGDMSAADAREAGLALIAAAAAAEGEKP